MLKYRRGDSFNGVDSMIPGVPDVVTVHGVDFRRGWTSKRFVPQAEIDESKVRELADAMHRQEPMPRAIIADYGRCIIPIDGHHRAAAARQTHRVLYAWICEGDAYDSLSCELGSHEADRLILNALQPHIAAGY